MFVAAPTNENQILS